MATLKYLILSSYGVALTPSTVKIETKLSNLGNDHAFASLHGWVGMKNSYLAQRVIAASPVIT